MATITKKMINPPMGAIEQIPLLLLSGGLDSTFMAWNALRSTDVDVLYVVARQHPVKRELELKAIDKIIDCLNSLYNVEDVNNPKRNIKHRIRFFYIVEFDPVIDGNTVDLGFSQPYMWLSGALAVVNASDHSELQIGYVCGDQINVYLQDIITAWSSLQKFTKAHGPIPVTFPQSLYRKSDLLYWYEKSLLEHVCVCENPDVKKRKPCGKCLPCSTMRATLREAAVQGKYYPELKRYWAYPRKYKDVDVAKLG